MVYSQICDWLKDFVEESVDGSIELVDIWDCTEWINDSEIISIFSDFVLPTYKFKKTRKDALQILHALIWEFYQFKRAEALCLLKDDVSAYERLKNTVSVPQHSLQWLQDKRELLTASEFVNILKDGESRLNILREKTAKKLDDINVNSVVAISSQNGSLNPRAWGHRFEPVIRQIYTALSNKTVFSEIGRIKHAKLDRLAASPDGVISNGRLLEIKAPFSRKIEKHNIPYEYYCQMQIQMEVCDVESVEYCECIFKSDNTFIDINSQNTPKYVGTIVVYGEANNYTTWKYLYSPLFPDTSEGRHMALSWVPQTEYTHDPDCNKCTIDIKGVDDAKFVTCDRCKEYSNSFILEKKVWQIEDWQLITVLRNRRWWTNIGLPAYNSFCADLTKANLDPMFLAPQNDFSSKNKINYPMFIDEI
jgi:hypothetical protein